jgi:hypothetical protein
MRSRILILCLSLLAASLGCREDAQSPPSPEADTASGAATTLLSSHQVSAG